MGCSRFQYFSFVVSSVKVKAGLHQVSDSWDSIVNGISPFANKRSINSIVVRLVLAASAYYVWQERNSRLFKQTKRTKEQLVDTIMAIVRLKLLSVRFKKLSRVESVMDEWDLPTSLMHNHVAR
ncbi:reverse transcriptase domain, Reverse transcriptase zinc-binding domain protein [Artemisia annua]|uniref:Reverse transcriptase domain, Reverse transcriptase zinc-binding domain protein n=1 Tax=Artemisia annua TaxID=35608 RepID=A0A2U1QDZ9_ARTAN|nr:reverse transcriptase domain, Reverse transcriptase zinc-binding domain protein [Artemisia annua]